MKTTNPSNITTSYCYGLLEKYNLSETVLEGSERVGAKMLKKILINCDQNSRFRVSWDPDSYEDDDGESDHSWDLIGPGLEHGVVFYPQRFEAEADRDALNNILREHFGSVTRTVEYTNDAYLAKSILDRPCCPACGSPNTDTNEHRFVGASCLVHKGCIDCDAEWTDYYGLSGYKDLRLD